MGAVTFYTTASAMSMKEAYSKAVEQAEFEEGHDSYNGTISTTRGFRDVTSDYKRSGLSLNDFIDKNQEGGGKYGSAWGICVTEPKANSNKIKSQVEHITSKGTKKWVLKYVVYDPHQDRPIATKNTKGDALKAAREYTEKTQQRTFIQMEKILEKGDACVARISYKSSSNEQRGKYVFFGLAAY